ncbi:MAG TPA: von Willebrand factor type A domain-containing protein [Candidatus Krumholzibacteria bacterium]|nr:von Willebrand factor type A domain-containing protein [Candidatus Krumholzibacteria bacterium]
MKLTIWTGIVLATALFAARIDAADTGIINGHVTLASTGAPIAGATVLVEGTAFKTKTDNTGAYTITNVPAGAYIVRAETGGTGAVQRVTVYAGLAITANFKLGLVQDLKNKPKDEARVDGSAMQYAPRVLRENESKMSMLGSPPASNGTMYYSPPPASTMWQTPDNESYDQINENNWFDTTDKPLSTFSVDVDAASYSNVRRFITEGQLPPADAVRIEELINYFDYDYPDPRGPHPFSITTEVADCPWNNEHKLVHIGLQGKRLEMDQLPPANLVFLIDVSGSMNEPDKLPLLKASFQMLVDQLRAEDRVAIVVYAGNAGLVLPSTPGSNKEAIRDAIDRLEAGGSTAGAAGIQLAYQIAQRSFMRSGNNRVILATDGDFNVGVSSDGELARLIEQKRDSGIFLTVLGFGQGNLKDSKMETLADKGNGHYAYVDNLAEGRKVFVNEIGATLLTIAKDVKLQVEFNPARVASYRLVGYENRLLQDRDFDDDTKDAGEIGAGHSVTALYEIALRGDENEHSHPHKYSGLFVQNDAKKSPDLLTVSFRYKRPDASESQLLEVPVRNRNTRFADASDNFRFSAAVAEFGMILRQSPQAGTATMDQVIRTARSARGEDEHGYRAEFVSLAETAKGLLQPTESAWR